MPRTFVLQLLLNYIISYNTITCQILIEEKFETNQAMNLICKAPFPIKWVLETTEHSPDFKNLFVLWSRRTFTEFDDVSTYNFELTLRVFKDEIPKITSRLACQSIAMPGVQERVQLEYHISNGSVSIFAAEKIESDIPAEANDRCPFTFNVHINNTGDVGFICNHGGSPLSTTFSRSFDLDAVFKFLSGGINVIKNSDCVRSIPKDGECEDCDYSTSSSSEAKGLYCYTNETVAVVVVFPKADTDTSEPHFFERSSEYLQQSIKLEYKKFPFYFVGEQVEVTLNWHKIKYYLAQGDVYITLQKDDLILRKATMNYWEAEDWTNTGYPNSTLTLDREITKFQNTGNLLLTIHLPLWNSTEWINASTVFEVVKPDLLYFFQTIESLVFYLNERDRGLTCDPNGDPRHITFSWNKEGSETKILSNNQTLIFPTILNEIIGRYTCTARHRSGQEAKKHFFVTVHYKDYTLLYVVTPIVLVALVFVLISIRLYQLNNFMKTTVVPESELKDFELGRPKIVTDVTGAQDQLSIVASLPYNTKYEVNARRIKIDKSIVLGSGEFGLVCQGRIDSINSQSSVEVAVKTVKHNSDISHIRSLLNELKVISYLENGHRNVLNIVGACTSRLRYGEILVCVELCKNNLLHLLSKVRESGNFNMAESEADLLLSETPDYLNNDIRLNTKVLMRWAYEIADGMAFLASKQVVHGDLAARNILLSKTFHVKISDFGLGRVMENYQYITITEETPLPWRWMSIEALIDRKFSSASDVWAYGITLWEIFSLGEIPYHGLQWNIQFVQELQSGMRMEAPEYATDELYTTLVKCWDPVPTNRPDFIQLKTAITSLLEEGTHGLNYLRLEFPNSSNFDSISIAESSC